MMDLGTVISSFKTRRVMVVGDIMLDRFVYGDVTRISPESPVPVLSAIREEKMLGGAGNVIANLRGLEVETTAIGLTGSDADGQIVRSLMEACGATSVGLLTVVDRPTITKTRFVAGHQQLLRVDEEKILKLPPEIEDALIANLKSRLEGHQALVLADYGKGVLSERVIAEAIAAAGILNIPVIVDPKGHDYSRYAGASVVTPNRKELSEATQNMPTASDTEVEAAGRYLLTSSGIKAIVATRSEDGISIIRAGEAPVHVATKALEVFDVSGAGDTVVAVLAASLAAKATLVEAAMLANAAGGVVVAKVGTSIIKADEIAEKLDLAASPRTGFTYEWEEAREQVKRWQARGLKVGFTNGCFDILHAGHVNYLNDARRYCDRLVLGLNHDASVRILKGPTRPVNVEQDRAAVMAGLAAISMVTLFGATEPGADNTPCDLISKLKPDIFFKGGDYTIDKLPEAKVVQAYGGEVKIMGLTEGLSTTKTIEKIGSTKVA
jgi:D-beta-D-heptose 7-phosphate kinase/D-beta-D-heptose 1-phosphate adenosyltransferase